MNFTMIQNDSPLGRTIQENNLEEFKKILKERVQEENILDHCLIAAARNGNLDFIRYIYEELDHPFCEGYPFKSEDTPLLWAAESGSMECVLYLLEHNANPFAVCTNGTNAVHNAISSGNVKLAKFLIEDCQIAWQGHTWEGISALHFALISNSPRMFGYVLSLGGLKYDQPKYRESATEADTPLLQNLDPMWQNFSPKWRKMLKGKFKQILKNYTEPYNVEKCPLYESARGGRFDVFKRLLNSYEYPVHENCLMNAACEGGNLDLFHYLLNEKKFSVPAEALEYAVTGANFELVNELIFDHGGNVHQTDSSGRTLLHWAVECGHWRKDMDERETIRIIKEDLLDWAELDVNAVSPKGSALDIACSNGDLELVRFLIEKAKATMDSEALCSAAEYAGHLPVVQYLVEQVGVSVNTQNDCGDTPLIRAMGNDTIDVAQYLLSHGADKMLKNHQNETALDLARSFEKTEFIKLLEDK